MNRRIFVRNLLVGSAGVLAVGSPLAALGRRESIRITLLHTNDLHTQIEPFDQSNVRNAGRGGLARIAEYARKCRAENPNTLLLDAGDMFQGTPYFNYYRGEVILKVMSAAGYDAGTLGNHEFDNGIEGVAEALPFAGFPLINSNYDFTGTLLEGKFPRFKIFNRSGIRIGIYGLGIDPNGLVSPRNFAGAKFNDPLTTAREMERYLAVGRHCDLVVCLSHLGLKYEGTKISDLTLAAETHHTDVIIGGHTHSFVEEPLQIENRSGKMCVVNQAGWGGLMIGHLDFHFEKGRKSPALTSYNQNF